MRLSSLRLVRLRALLVAGSWVLVACAGRSTKEERTSGSAGSGASGGAGAGGGSAKGGGSGSGSAGVAGTVPAMAGGAGTTGGDPSSCTPTAVNSLCVEGVAIDSGDLLQEGMPLSIVLRPGGCHSSSCTTVVPACSVKADGDDFVVEAELCLGTTGTDRVCTRDCGGGSAVCGSDYVLTEGAHTVRLVNGAFDLAVTFAVPGVVTDGSLCATMDLER